MKVVVLFSGGKDSVYATHLCLSWGWEVEWLTVHPQEDSMMFHHPNTHACYFQSKAAGIRWKEISTVHEKELYHLERAIERQKVDGIVSGAIASEYQKQRIEIIGNNLGLPTFAPLWHKKSDILREMLNEMDVRFVSVSAQGLGEEWLGKRYAPDDVAKLEAMRPEVNPFLEGGEGETFVCDAPFFGKRLEILDAKKQWAGQSGRMLFTKAGLSEKP